MIDRFRQISYFLAYAVATIPLWHYIRDGRILILMVAVMLFAYIMVVLSSVQVSQKILSSEKSKITFPRWLPDKLKYQKWWSLSRHTLKWHLFLVLPKMGLALGFTYWLHLGTRATMTHSILRPYFYASRATGESYPDWEAVLLAFTFFSLFTICEAFLISSLFLITHRSSRLIMLRILLALSIIGIMNQYQEHTNHIMGWDCRIEACPSYNNISILGRNFTHMQVNRYFSDTFEVGCLNLSGMDVLHGANLMRIHPDYIDIRPFVARQVVAGLLGLLLYAGSTWVILWFVEDESESTLT